MTDQISEAWIAQRREARYCRTPERRIQTIDQARAFVDDVGFCFFWPIKDIEMPNLFHAIAGRVRPVPMAHNDPDLSKSWGWKDRSLDQRWWYYGKMLRRRSTLISLDMLPFFYASSGNYGELDDYLQEYRSGTMTAEAKRVYEALLTHGPLDTVRLRREAQMAAEKAKSRFERALVELQVGLKVLPIGVAEAGAWRYAFIYEIVPRHYPDLAEAARQISLGKARRVLVARYLDNVVAADRRMIGLVFHVLGWTAADLNHTIAALLDEGVVRMTHADREQERRLVSTRALEDAR